MVTVPLEDIIIFQIRGGNWRRPEYIGVPPYFGFANDCTDRWWTLQGAGAYGTGALSPANIYPLDGKLPKPWGSRDPAAGGSWTPAS